ncbi:MAG: chlorophyll synthase ChlG [Chloroflexaceae bacterium]|nr:chlorophyll synthase ChlG [Chloroflexaceae bacterium]NJO06112.1 chlorophyll synthase ChlG [Chloroflexaceae bacterium]
MQNLRKSSPVAQSAAPGASQAVHPPASFGVLLKRSITLMKPITWFAPAWAFLCGAIASGALTWELTSLGYLLLGLLMAGPVLCGLSQVINDYCDSEVDAINEPHRLIPSGLITPRHVQIIVTALLIFGSLLAIVLGRAVALFVGIGLLFAMAYSMKPFRAKRNGWIGNTLVALSYEGLAWLAGHATFAALTWESKSLPLVLLFSIGAHGIMTVNDFKSITGDTQMGIRSIPVMYGKRIAARMVVATMAGAQFGVITLLVVWGHLIAAAVIGLLLLIQTIPFVRFVRDPDHNAVFFNATAIMLYVWGMLVAAIGVAA